MDENPDLELKNLCCTCLCTDRKLIQLCKINDGVNILYLLLSYDSEAYKEGFYKDSASLHICWECRALMRRVATFRQQTCIAQKLLSCITDGRNDTKPLKSLSRLTHYHKTTYDKCITSSSADVTVNFIDCNAIEDIKNEGDELDDLPLSVLSQPRVENRFVPDDIDLSKNDLELQDTSLIELNDIIDDDYSQEIITKKKPKRLKKQDKVYKKKVRKKKITGNEIVIGITEDIDSKNLVNRDVIKCEPCVEMFKSSIELEEHNLAIHNDDGDDDKELNSKGDKTKREKRRTALKQGTKRKNYNLMDKRTPYGYQCTECNKYFDNKNQRWKHTQRCHREGFRCHACGRRFAFRNNLTRHEALHAGPPPREECPVCHKMIRSDLVKVHARIHTQRERFSCSICDKTFVSRASYQHHLKYTQAHAATDILKYKCGMCDKGYRSRGELRDHENYQHRGETRHKCPICAKPLATRRCITRHVRRAHDGIKESARDKICQQCGKAFRDKKGLREHEFIHTGERPLSCEVCGCTFRQSASLYTHRKRVHHIHSPRKQVQILTNDNMT